MTNVINTLWSRIRGVTRRVSLSSQVVGDPRLCFYLDPMDGYCSVLARMDVGMAFNAFTLGHDSCHPWFLAAQALSRDATDQARQILAAYYRLVRPASLADWHDVPAGDSPELASLPIHGWSVMPWSPREPLEAIRRVERAQLTENRNLGLDAGIEAGAKAFGPMTEGKLRVELLRLEQLVHSIRASGFQTQRKDYDLGGIFLVVGERWRWLGTSGMHRVPVAAALGVPELPLRAIAVVRPEDVAVWPQVRSGLFSKAAALALFDRLFDGRPPACARAWIDWVRDNR
jgi:hypothetical protein